MSLERHRREALRAREIVDLKCGEFDSVGTFRRARAECLRHFQRAREGERARRRLAKRQSVEIGHHRDANFTGREIGIGAIFDRAVKRGKGWLKHGEEHGGCEAVRDEGEIAFGARLAPACLAIVLPRGMKHRHLARIFRVSRNIALKRKQPLRHGHLPSKDERRKPRRRSPFGDPQGGRRGNDLAVPRRYV